MPTEKKLNELGICLFKTFYFLETTPHLRIIPYSTLFASDISNFLMTFSLNPLNNLKNIDWDISLEDKMLMHCLIESNTAEIDLKTEIPLIFKMMYLHRRNLNKIDQETFSEIFSCLYEFFSHLGDFIAEENTKIQNSDKKNQDLQNCVDRIKKFIPQDTI